MMPNELNELKLYHIHVKADSSLSNNSSCSTSTLARNISDSGFGEINCVRKKIVASAMATGELRARGDRY